MTRSPRKSPVDLALLVYDLRASGVVRNLIALAGMAARRGLQVEIWVIRNRGHMAGSVPDGVSVVEVPNQTIFVPGRTLDLVASVLPLSSFIRTRQPGVLFSAGNQIHMTASLAFALAGRPPGTRFAGRASISVLGARTGVDDSQPSLLTRLLRSVDRLQYRGMHCVVSVSEELHGQLERQLLIEPERLLVIPNGVDTKTINRTRDIAPPHPWLASGQPPVVLGVGRLVRQKNFPLLLKAFARARTRRPLRLIILGHGTLQARRSLAALADSLGIAADVALCGFQPNPEHWMRHAATLAVSSRREGSSNVVLEALACGCPVTAVACPTGIVEVLGSRYGTVVKDDNAESLAAGILATLANPPAPAELMSRARQYDRRMMLERYAGVFEALVRGEDVGKIVVADTAPLAA
ncbi:MAG: glycosyltransferase [Gammaproteobacteria bacterium]|nr:glycosyltransferase [Gammaproteobacteria bacterium]